MNIIYRNPHELIPYARNPKQHPQDQIDKIARQINEVGFLVPIILDKDNVVISGHGRLLAAKALGMDKVPTLTADNLTEEQAIAFRIADNKVAESGWELPQLGFELGTLERRNIDLTLTGFNLDEIQTILKDFGQGTQSGDCGAPQADPAQGPSLADRFLVPPFSVLDARQGYWQERKRQWLALGIESEVGRNKELLGNKSRESYGGNYDLSKGESAWGGSGTSIFDPVLCELAYLWFSPENGTVLDPFAGGSVRGVVASKLKRNYIGVELRQEQVDANKAQGVKLCPELSPDWRCGDSVHMDTICSGVQADLLFSCPPYGDLEVYSDTPEDISNMPYEKFLEAYRTIIQKSFQHLKDNRFAVWVVGEMRDKNGFYRNFVGDTVRAFLDAGFALYNEAVLVTAVGSLPLRAGRAFSISRKLGKSHQNVLVFVKGDPKIAAQACGEVRIEILEGAVSANEQL